MITALVLTSLIGFREVQVLRVYDGDTVFVDLGHDVPELLGKNIGVRIKGIDSPEIKDKRACMKAKAYEAKAYLTYFIDAKPVTLDFCDRDKYFRILCTLRNAEGKDAGSFMLERGFAQPYSGKTKIKWSCK